MDNEKVRVPDLRRNPGEIAPMYDLPGDHVEYVMNTARSRLTFSDGASRERDLTAGQTFWMERDRTQPRASGQRTDTISSSN